MSPPQTAAVREAEQKLRKRLRKQPNDVLALRDLVGLLAGAGRAAEAETAARQLCKLAPQVGEAHFWHGLMLRDLGRRQEADAALSRALALAPTAGPGFLARGATRLELGRLEAAIADLERATALLPDPFEALALKSNALGQLNRLAEALAAIDLALKRRPEAGEAWRARAMLLAGLDRRDEADFAIAKAIELRPDDPEAWAAKGDLEARAQRHAAAIEAFAHALALAPQRADIEEHLIATRRAACDWRSFAVDESRVRAWARDPAYPVRPFQLLGFATSPAEQLAAARKYTGAFAPLLPALPFAAPRAEGPIRVAYLSSDFRAHAVAYLLAGVIERHDRSRFAISAISVRPDDGSDMRRRLQAAFGDFVEAAAWSDERIAAHIRERGVDILVDLNGLSGEARPGVLARRPAPVQAFWLGYPGTTGAPYVDYLIADRFVIPEADREHYSEAVVTLPGAYLPTDDRRLVAPTRPSRTDLGLPERGFVFAAYNASFKLTPDDFRLWMRILAAEPGSVLWLRQQNASVVENLRREATALGVDPDRLVFAPFAARDEDYLARLGVADLFLDSRLYNAHTTAADALWAGAPVLTRPGPAFAGRVAASLLQVAGSPELIVDSDEAYVETALALARDPVRLQTLRDKVRMQARASALFDTERFTRRLERAFEAMHARRLAGEAPAALEVAE